MRAVITPEGRFRSTLAAGRHHGIDKTTAATWAHRRVNGWRFEDGKYPPKMDIVLAAPPSRRPGMTRA